MKFHLCQRIRKVRGDLCLGMEGTVSGFPTDDPPYDMDIIAMTSASCVTRLFGVYPVAMTYAPGDSVRVISCQWEPVVPPDMESIEEVNALNQPEQVTA